MTNTRPRHSRESGNPASSLPGSDKERGQRDPRFRGGDEEVVGTGWNAEAIRAAAADGFDLTLLKEPPARIVAAEACAPLTVRVRFDDGVAGTVRFEQSHLTGVFEPLNEPNFFAQVHIDDGALAWSEDLDMCPDAIYMKVVMNGEWVLQ